MAPGSTATRLLVPWSTTVMRRVVLSKDSGEVSLGVVRSGVAVGKALTESGDSPEAGQRDETEEYVAVVDELRKEDQRRTHERERHDAEDVDRHPGASQVERAGLRGRDGAAAMTDQQRDSLQEVGREYGQRRQSHDEEEHLLAHQRRQQQDR